MLAELPCFPPLIGGVRGDAGVVVQRHAVELCTAAVDQETTSPGVRGTFLPFVGAEMTQQERWGRGSGSGKWWEGVWD